MAHLNATLVCLGSLMMLSVQDRSCHLACQRRLAVVCYLHTLPCLTLKMKAEGWDAWSVPSASKILTAFRTEHEASLTTMAPQHAPWLSGTMPCSEAQLRSCLLRVHASTAAVLATIAQHHSAASCV